MISKVLAKLMGHKIITGILLLIIIVGGYFGYKKFFSDDQMTRYVIDKVQKGTLVVSISGSGQVSAVQQIDIKSKVSGDVTSVNFKASQYVAAGAILAQLDSSDAQKTVRDARLNLENAQLALEKLKQSSADINKITEDAYNSISNTFLNLPTIISGAEMIINGSTINSNQSNAGYYKDFVNIVDRDQAALFIFSAFTDYTSARSQFDETLAQYKKTSRYANGQMIINLLNQTISTVKTISQTLKSEQGLLDYLIDYASRHAGKNLSSLVNTYRGNLQTYISQTNNSLSDLTNAQNNIKNVPLDISSQELTVKQRENALLDAQEKLLYYDIRSPSNGIIAKYNINHYDSVASGFAIANLITQQKLAEISLNEVDVAKIKIGQKATLTFDAIPELTVSGRVAEVDTVGTVSQGVVTYNIKISFNSADNRIKPSMSVSAAINSEEKIDALIVPNSAIKSQGEENYVEIIENENFNSESGRQNFTGRNSVNFPRPNSTNPEGLNSFSANISAAALKNPPRRQRIQIGTAGDEFTEIIDGLKEGDLVVARTIQLSANQTQAQPSGGLRFPGVPSSGGGGFRTGPRN